MYSIYHIPTFVHKDGSIGKIGCTVQKPKKRVQEQGYSSYEILEEHFCIDRASIRERELQQQYGYPTDSGLYKNHYYKMKKIRKPWSDKAREASQLAQKDKWDNFTKAGNKARIKPCLMIHKDTNEILKEFKSISEAGRYLGEKYAGKVIPSVCLGRYGRKSAYGYKWEYKK